MYLDYVNKIEQIYLLLTTSCNLSCSHCIRDYGSNSFIDSKKLYYILDEFSEFSKKKMLVLTGGEPTLHPEFCNILKYSLNTFKYVVSVNTNGTTDFFNEDNLRDLSRYRNLIVQVSLDGDRDEHDSIRGRGSFEKAFETLRLLNRMNIKTSVATTVRRQNIESVKRLHKKLVELKLENWMISRELPFGAARKNDRKIETGEWNEYVEDILEYSKIRTRIMKSYDFSLLDRISCEELHNLEEKAVTNCGTAKQKIYIYPDFTVYGCTCLSDYPLGNLENDSLNKILGSESALMFSDYDLDQDSPCRKCRYLGICRGGCIGMSLHVLGKLGLGDPNCPLVNEYYSMKGSQ
jgi:radical SAM protein with 4Fe4S-binding SPASM domain